jgi:hypothetical protein
MEIQHLYYQKHNPNDLQEGTGNKNIAATLETRNCKHTRLAKE